MESRAVQPDVTSLNGDRRVTPKAPPVKGTRTAAQMAVTPQQTRPGRRSANKDAAEIVGVFSQRKTVVAVWSTSEGHQKSPVRQPGVKQKWLNILSKKKERKKERKIDR